MFIEYKFTWCINNLFLLHNYNCNSSSSPPIPIGATGPQCDVTGEQHASKRFWCLTAIVHWRAWSMYRAIWLSLTFVVFPVAAVEQAGADCIWSDWGRLSAARQFSE